MNIIYSDFKEQWGNIKPARIYVQHGKLSAQNNTYEFCSVEAFKHLCDYLRKACFWWTQLLRPFCRAADDLHFSTKEGKWCIIQSGTCWTL